MKNKTILCLLSLAMLLNISATQMAPSKSSTHQTSSNIQIERATDGTSTITVNGEQEDGFTFVTPDGLYPISIPSTPDEIEKFENVLGENNLPFNEERLNSELSAEDDRTMLMIYDLNSEHYQKEKHVLYVAGKFAGPEEPVPGWALGAALKGLQYSFPDQIIKVDTQEIDDQQIVIIEVVIPLNEDESDGNEFITVKAILFIRGGKLITIAGMTNNNEWLPDVNNAIDSISNSLDFDLKN